MSEQRASYRLPACPGAPRPCAFGLPAPVDLGQHRLAVRAEKQTVVITQHTRATQGIELTKEEAYRLLVTLQWVFAQEMAHDKEGQTARQGGSHGAAHKKD